MRFVLAVGGLVTQTLLGIPSSNYTRNGDGPALLVPFGVVLVVLAGVPLLRAWVQRGRPESEDLSGQRSPSSIE